ncbi:GNAT family N-acetyltransferase [Gaiella sp.]|uniref:GNAT family N-acetyltransferase n=1 Tax=Gaiella sp. TaxID=2663207 RepID=UPI002BF42E35|nr:GNAT family N-acetyltransferase [Gaiella sp.]HWO81599.1 GNAT family N-acetyltransferase [Gaiella sp.]
MNVRAATSADVPVLEALWRAFEGEVPPPAHVELDLARELAELREAVDDGLAFVAEVDGEAVGFALARRTGSRLARLTDLYVVPEARRGGVAAALVHAVVEAVAPQGIEHLDLEVTAANAGARAVYHRWGFGEDVVVLVAPVTALRERLAPGRHAVSFASIHVQTDAVGDVERAARAFAPRIGSSGSRVEGPRNGWVAVYDPVIDEDPTALVRYAREVSSRMGTIVVALSLEVDEVVRMVALDRGGIVDEYLSVPEFYGPLAPGDVIGLAANPTVLARLTGADPQRVRAAAPNAAAPADLPPAREILSELAAVLGLEGADHGHTTPDGSSAG